ncbi:MAG: DnaA ATPase domain-containing protein [Erysipelotrichaceae bacterium]
MSKINLDNYVLSPKEEAERLQVVKLILNNENIKNWLLLNKFDPQELINHSGKFERFINTLEICEKCQGLDNCKFKNRGYYESLHYNEILSFSFKPCRYNYDAKITHKKNIINWDLGKHDYLNSFADMQLPTNDSDYIQIVSTIKAEVEKKVKGLFIFGSFGVGKSYLLSCIANYFAQKNYSVALYSVSSFASKVLTSLDSKEIKQELMNDMKKCDILLLDDIGSVMLGPWLRDDWLNDILTTRMNNKSLTYFSSNLALDDLKKVFMAKGNSNFNEINVERLMERIEVLATPVKLTGKNWRRDGK